MKQFTDLIIPIHVDEQRLDLYLRANFPYQSRSSWQKEIELGNVSLNGSLVRIPARIVRSGDVLKYLGAEFVEPEVDRNYSILYEDEYFFVINKPANLPVHPSGIFYKNTLLTFLEQKFKRSFYMIHRIDRETSGVIVVGKDFSVSSTIQQNFSTVKKSYLAIVKGEPSFDYLEVDLSIGLARNSIISKKREAYIGAKETAFTSFKKIQVCNDYSLLQAFPKTGRLHQIRVHLASIGLPILGDKLYGLNENLYIEYTKNGPTENLVANFGFHRCALHSASICFVHPKSKQEMVFEADLPDDMKLFFLNGNNG